MASLLPMPASLSLVAVALLSVLVAVFMTPSVGSGSTRPLEFSVGLLASAVVGLVATIAVDVIEAVGLQPGRSISNCSKSVLLQLVSSMDAT